MIRFVLEPPVTPRDRLAAFRAVCARSGMTEGQACEALGYSRNQAMLVLAGERTSRPCSAKLAEFIGVPRPGAVV